MYENNCDQNTVKQMRKIRPTRRSVSGSYPFRGEMAIEFESTLERDFLIRTEFCSAVLDVIPQPVEIPFVGANGRSYKYTPDFLVYYCLGNRAYGDYPKPVLVEVKPEVEWRKHWREWMPKWKAAWRYATEQGWVFHVRDESRIRDQTFSNIRFLQRYQRMSFSDEETLLVLESVRQMGCATPDYLLSRHFMGIYRAEGIAHIWHLLAARRLDCDISRPLNGFTELWVPTNE
jgi:TnsA endonuclease N terminal/TnsA endonuclease C terminal